MNTSRLQKQARNEEEARALDGTIAHAIKTLASSLGQAVLDGRRTCVHCVHFVDGAETCALAGQRPPARVIAFGCQAFVFDDIPF